MKKAVWVLLCAITPIVLAGTMANSSNQSAEKQRKGQDEEQLYRLKEQRRKKAPPLSLEGLKLEKLPEAKEEPIELKADNSACLVCHGNYEREPLSLAHAKAGIGCARCHGKSLDHRDDENNTTPPDKMYPASSIDRMCSRCHKKHIAQPRSVIALWLKRCPDKKPAELVCTDCHFRHRLPYRTVRWDKRTGKLLEDGQNQPRPSGAKPK